ncbi:MAG: Type secretory pathway component VirB8-like [Ramlibacter sp.]|nr:Type secretory pathway component VirB8-like [Ramlibacter sp.]
MHPDAASQFAEIYGSSRVEATRWFLVSLACIGLAITCAVAVVVLLPLKEVRPWVVEVNPASGVVNRPVEVLRLEPNIGVVKAELARWTEAVYRIDPLRSSELLRWANARSADKAVRQFEEFRVRERIYERINREPEMLREAKVSAVDVSQRGTAFIFLTTTERVGAAPVLPEKTRRFRITLNYKLAAPTQEVDVLSNPLGLFVTFFSDAEERVL